MASDRLLFFCRVGGVAGSPVRLARYAVRGGSGLDGLDRRPGGLADPGLGKRRGRSPVVVVGRHDADELRLIVVDDDAVPGWLARVGADVAVARPAIGVLVALLEAHRSSGAR